MKKTNAHPFARFFSRLAVCQTPSFPFVLGVPGVGTIDSYASPEEAEQAISLLPISQQDNAYLYDVDGYCLSR